MKIDDLLRFNIEITEFDPLNPLDHTIFQPMPVTEFSKYELEQELFHGLMTDNVKLTDLELPDPASNSASRLDIERAAMRESQRLYRYIDLLYTCHSQIEEPNNPISMAVGWISIPVPLPQYTWPRELGPNSWPRDHGMLSHDLGPEHVGWKCEMVSEWKDRSGRTTKVWPHVRMAVCHGHSGDPHGILIGELGAIAQVILNRLNQPQFDNESYFPVLMLSFFGPRHIRLLQAVYRPAGYLELRASQIFDFTTLAVSRLDLMLEYLACSPRRDHH
ncbi:Uncharacterized protein PECH_006133 [Penicillium ucsense]|uniref:Uncharacterized protein n=1 Tax=Penicillium ucsense TaxID=2839758 RepID=A0A8J8W1R8_9EURO|nr:Uncharacterized protein PECM_006606 [Penicillium ucsense]KAF7735780.1 Uncharacterized protein PECH_006133 [Penicillium ucsense]